MRKLPPLSSLRAFEAAARHLSFKRAADELGVTPTAVSHQIRLLEEICGMPLFRRRPLTLTDDGARLFPVLRDGFDAFAHALGAARARIDHAPLRVTTPSAFASRWLVPRLPQWRAAHPEVPLDIIGTDELVDLRSGDADVAVRYANIMPTGCSGREIFRDTFFPVCSPSLLKDGKAVNRAADLLHYPLIHFDWLRAGPATPNWQRWLETARAIDPEIKEVTRVWDLSFREEIHAIDAVIAGQGIAICSDVVVSRELAHGELVKAHSLSLAGFGFYVVRRPWHPRQVTIDDFAEWMRSCFEYGSGR